ncbi:hypothetical protein EJB05_09336, partial [Eragrostis curvula]
MGLNTHSFRTLVVFPAPEVDDYEAVPGGNDPTNEFNDGSCRRPKWRDAEAVATKRAASSWWTTNLPTGRRPARQMNAESPAALRAFAQCSKRDAAVTVAIPFLRFHRSGSRFSFLYSERFRSSNFRVDALPSPSRYASRIV